MGSLRGASTLAVLIVLVLGHGSRADAAPSIDSAKALVDASDYITARTQLTELLDAGTSGPEELAEIYRLSGIVAGALGETAASTEAFKRCLALAPKATLPVGTSPKIGRPFAAAQEFFKTNTPLKVRVVTAKTPPAITIITESDPVAMIAKFRVIAETDGKPAQVIERPGADEVTVALSVGQRIDLRMVALDDKGNRLATVGSTDVPIVIIGPAGSKPTTGTVGLKKPTEPKPAQPARERPLYLKWWLWGGAAVAFGAAGTYFGISAMSGKDELDALNATSLSHTFDEATEVEDRTRRDVLFTNIGLGAAAVFGVAATILYLTAPDAPAQERLTTISPVPVHGGGAIVLGGTF